MQSGGDRARKNNQGEVRRILQGQRCVLRQSARQGQDQRLFQQFQIIEFEARLVGQGRNQQAGVDAVVQQVVDLDVGGRFLQHDLHLREGGAVAAQERRQHAVVGRRHEGQRQASALSCGGSARQFRQFVRLRQQAPRFRQQGGAGGRERHAAAAAHEQRRGQQRFQSLDRLRQRRLGHVQASGGPAEMELFGDGDKIAQLAQFQAHM